jgi:peroxiredoxin
MYLHSLKNKALVYAALVSFLLSSTLVRGECSIEDSPADLSFTLQDVAGDDVLLSDYLGKVIILDFWATWCAPCRIEIPGFIELLDQYESQGFAVLGVSIDDTVESLELYMEEMEMDYPVLVGAGRNDIFDTYGPLVGFPTTYMIDRAGNICEKHIGFSAKEQFEMELLELL